MGPRIGITRATTRSLRFWIAGQPIRLERDLSAKNVSIFLPILLTLFEAPGYHA